MSRSKFSRIVDHDSCINFHFLGGFDIQSVEILSGLDLTWYSSSCSTALAAWAISISAVAGDTRLGGSAKFMLCYAMLCLMMWCDVYKQKFKPMKNGREDWLWLLSTGVSGKVVSSFGPPLPLAPKISFSFSLSFVFTDQTGNMGLRKDHLSGTLMLMLTSVPF